MFHKPLQRCAPDSPDHEYLPPDGSWEGVDEPGEEGC